MRSWHTAMVAAVLMLAGMTAPVAADDRHAGYYYPAPSSTEEFVAREATLPDNDRLRRIGFTIGIARQLNDNPYPPTFAIFAKGSEAEKLIIVALGDHYDTLYRLRALMATMTSLARSTELFKMLENDQLTFYDLCTMLGFEQITLTDGREMAHQVKLSPP